jgi:hypothetical protein
MTALLSDSDRRINDSEGHETFHDMRSAPATSKIAETNVSQHLAAFRAVRR